MLANYLKCNEHLFQKSQRNRSFITVVCSAIIISNSFAAYLIWMEVHEHKSGFVDLWSRKPIAGNTMNTFLISMARSMNTFWRTPFWYHGNFRGYFDWKTVYCVIDIGICEAFGPKWKFSHSVTPCQLHYQMFHSGNIVSIASLLRRRREVPCWKAIFPYLFQEWRNSTVFDSFEWNEKKS